MGVSQSRMRNGIADRYKRTKYGIAISAAPTSTISQLLDTKYGNTINPNPHTSGIGAFCFLPYTK